MPQVLPDRLRLILELIRDLQLRGREQVVFGPFDEVNDPFVVVGGEVPERRGCGPVCEFNAATPYRRIGVARFSPVPVCVVDAELHLKQGEGASVGDGGWDELALRESIKRWHSSLSIRAPQYVAHLAPCGGLVLVEATQEGTAHVLRVRVRSVGSGEQVTAVWDEGHGPLWELPGVTITKGGLRLLDELAAQRSAETPPDGVTDEPGRQVDLARHGPDFRSVCWYGRRFTFTGREARCVSILWAASENGTPDVGDAYLIEAIEPDTDSQVQQLRQVFKSNPAWGEMIVEGGRKGTHRLAPPPKKTDHPPNSCVATHQTTHVAA